MTTDSAPHARSVLVAYERMPGWVERFDNRHGPTSVERDGHRVRVRAADGALAEYDDIAPPHRFGLLLVRRGGYAIGLVQGSELVASKCGTRYVQGKTKAGGWSQQRYARRRANQASELVGAAATALERVFAEEAELYCFGGGDRQLVRETAETGAISIRLAERWLDVGEPRLAVLREAVGQARSVRVWMNALA